MKKKIVVVALLVILLALLALGTMAFDARNGYTSNIITTGKIDMTLKEHLTGNWGEVDGVMKLEDNAMPGQTLGKQVVISNAMEKDEDPEAKTSFYTRVRVTITIDDETLADQVVLYVLPLFNEDGSWFLGEDGWWYYDGILDPGEETTPLFDGVELAGETPNAFKGKTVSIRIEAQAVQSRNNPTVGVHDAGVRSAAGWPKSEG